MQISCILDFDGTREDHLPLEKFVYNKSFQSSIGMAPFEALYGRPCRSLLYWVDEGESTIVRRRAVDTTEEITLLGPKLITESTKKIALIIQRIRAEQCR